MNHYDLGVSLSLSNSLCLNEGKLSGSAVLLGSATHVPYGQTAY